MRAGAKPHAIWGTHISISTPLPRPRSARADLLRPHALPSLLGATTTPSYARHAWPDLVTRLFHGFVDYY
jgi:hypothetical protein